MTGPTPPSSSTSPSPSPNRPSPGTSIRLKIIKWLFFNILFALIPLIYRYLKLCIFDHGHCDNHVELLANKGELLLLSTAVFAESIGELTNSDPHHKHIALVIMGFSFLVIILNTNMFLDINGFSNERTVAFWSCSIYFTSIIIGISGKILGRD